MQHALSAAAAAPPEQVTQDAGLLLLQLAGRPGQVGGILESVVDPISIEVRDVVALLPRLLLQVLAELQALLGRQPRERLLGRLLVHLA